MSTIMVSGRTGCPDDPDWLDQRLDPPGDSDGSMTPDELAAAGERLYGRHWRAKLARDLRVHRATVGRYAKGETTIPGPVAQLVRTWVLHKSKPSRLSGGKRRRG